MIDEIAKKEYLRFIDKELEFHKDSPYDEIPKSILLLRDKFLEVCDK